MALAAVCIVFCVVTGIRWLYRALWGMEQTREFESQAWAANLSKAAGDVGVERLIDASPPIPYLTGEYSTLVLIVIGGLILSAPILAIGMTLSSTKPGWLIGCVAWATALGIAWKSLYYVLAVCLVPGFLCVAWLLRRRAHKVAPHLFLTKIPSAVGYLALLAGILCVANLWSTSSRSAEESDSALIYPVYHAADSPEFTGYSATQIRDQMSNHTGEGQFLEDLTPDDIRSRIRAWKPAHYAGIGHSGLSRQFWIGILYILLLTAATFWACISRIRAPHLSTLAVAIATVTTSYFAVGGAFATVYHSMYVGQAARYNGFLRWYITQRHELAEQSSDPDGSPPALAHWRRLDPYRVLEAVRGYVQTEASFTQDRPTRQGGKLLLWKRVLGATFTFRRGRYTIDLGNTPEGAQNSLAVRRFDEFLNALRQENKQDSDPRFRVQIAGGADHTVRAGTPDDQLESNQRLGMLRSEETQHYLERLLPEQTDLRTIMRLRESLHDPAALSAYPLEQRFREEPVEVHERILTELLWPGDPRPQDGEPNGAWLAAGVSIDRGSLDPLGTNTVMQITNEPLSLTDLLYYSLVRLGDIRPVSTTARLLAMLHYVLIAVFIVLFSLAVAISEHPQTPADRNNPRTMAAGAGGA